MNFAPVQIKTASATVLTDSDLGSDLYPVPNSNNSATTTNNSTVVSNMIDYKELLENNEEGKNWIS